MELEKSVKVLVELLEKSNIKVPNCVGPKLFNNLSESVHDENKKCENETVNKSSSNECKVSPNNTECKTNTPNEMTVKLSTNNQISYKKPQVNLPEKQNEKRQIQTQQKQIQSQQIQHEATKQKSQLNTLPDLKEVQSFGSVDLIPVSNATKQDPKVHEKPVKNFVEITPLISAQNENISKKPEKSDDNPTHQPKVSACVEGKIAFF